MSNVIMNRLRGKTIRLKCLKCGHEVHIFKEGNANYLKQVEKIQNEKCKGAGRGDGRNIIGNKVEPCGGKMHLDKRLICQG